MYTDKSLAIKGQWRTPEAKFFAIAALFGSLGIWIGMYLFRHKTKHFKFVVFIPSILAMQIYIFFTYIIKVLP
ncbi:MAG: hypothetical protein K0R54_345 [Clostridiaceae bacterium]|jgi:uncharacterized membrane protein YsdA (DUF1294 family)|nr:hypothetical protein [Clostridiaceae bacterium]